MSSAAASAILEGMPDASDLRVLRSDGVTWVSAGKSVLFRFADDDTGMRNVAVAALRQIGFPGQQVAAALGLTENYVATLHQRALREGTAGLVRPRGRPRTLEPSQWDTAREWRAAGVRDAEIARRLGVQQSTVLRRLGPAAVQCTLEEAAAEPGPAAGREDEPVPEPGPGPGSRAGTQAPPEPGPGQRERPAGVGGGSGDAVAAAGRRRRRAAGCFPGTRGRCCCTPTRGRAPASWPAQRAATCARRRCCGR